MLKKITAERFFKPQNRTPAPKLNYQIDLGLRTLQGKDRQILQKYVPLLKNLDALTFAKNAELIKGACQDLKNQDIVASISKFNTATKSFSRSSVNSFVELYSKHPQDAWMPLDQLVVEIAKLPAEQAVRFSSRILNLLIAPRIVKLKSEADAIEYIQALAANAKTAVHFEAANLAVNQYLARTGVNVKNFVRVLEGLDPRLTPRIDAHNASKIHLQNERSELLQLFSVFRSRNVALNTPQMSTFLRALFTTTDAGSAAIIDAIPYCEFSVGFYHYLVRVLCLRKDVETVNWLFANRIMPLMESNPKLIPFLLHTLLIRTLELDGFAQSKDVLTAMGSDVLEPSWLALFVQFRKVGEIDRAFDTLRRAINNFSLKLSLNFVNDYLLLVSHHFKPGVYLRSLLTAFPEFRDTFEELELLNFDLAAGTDPSFVVLPEHRGFDPKAIHETTLATAYDVVLNECFNVNEIMNLYNTYENYVFSQNSRVTMAIVDKFVCKLIRLDQAGLVAAESVYKSALLRLRIRQPLDGRFRNTSLFELVTNKAKRGDLKGAIKLVLLTSQNPNMPLRGKAVRKLYHLLREDDVERAEAFAKWAESEGLILEPPSEPKKEVEPQPSVDAFPESAFESNSKC